MVSTLFVSFVGTIGALANWTIPIAAMQNVYFQPAEQIRPEMTLTLLVYSSIFLRWSIAISPANWPLFACHVTNALTQAVTLGKWAQHSLLMPKLVEASSQDATREKQ